MLKNIYLDIETSRFFQDPEVASLPRSKQLDMIAGGRVFAITYCNGVWYTWNDPRDLWAYLRGSLIITWNGNEFDIPVVQKAASLGGYDDPSLDPWYSLDLFAECRVRTGRWYKLGFIAEGNLGRGKSGDGQSAAEWFRSGEIERVEAYCRDDVQLLVDLYHVAQTTGLLLPPKPNDVRDANPDITFRLFLNGSKWRLLANEAEIDQSTVG